MSDSQLRILIVRLSHLGDVVQTLPLYHALRGAYPSARIAWAIQPEFEGLVRALPGLDRTIVFRRREGARAWLQLVRDLEDFGAEWSIDAQGNTKSALVSLAARAARRSGYARTDWREPFAATSVTDPCAPSETVEHAVERVLRLARHCVSPARTQPRFDAEVSRAEIDQAERTLAELDLGENGVLLHISPPADVRSWPLAHFTELARTRAEHGPVLVLSGPAEESEGRALERDLRHPRIAHVVGQRGLRELAALFTVCAQRGTTFVGSDSGPMHLAWASGMRVVLLAGPQDERRTGPYAIGLDHRVVRSSRNLECTPCMSRSCTHEEGPVCMASTTADAAAHALRGAV